MSQNFPALIIIIPLLAALVVTASGWINKSYCFPLALGAVGLSFLSSLGILTYVLTFESLSYKMAGWSGPIGIVYEIDYLNSPVLVIITFVAFMNLLGTRQSVQSEFPEKIGAFYALYLLFVCGMVGIVITGDAFNLYVLLEIAALTGYSLIGLGERRAPMSALNYLFMGTIGASFYLLGVGYLYMVTGSLNMHDLASLLPGLYQNPIVKLAFCFCLAGLFIKMAFFPMHGWLPNAYSFSPAPSISLIAPLTTKVMIYVMIRISLSVFTPEFTFSVLVLGKYLVWLAAIAIVAASMLALAQTSLKKMLTYIVIAEVGYMVGGFWLGNRLGITGATLHIINDAAMTLCAFMAAGIFAYKIEGDSFENLQGLFGKMPFTMIGFVIGGMAIIGVPPTCGFFSKWYLISGGIAAGQYGFVVALLFSSLVNAILFFKIFEIAYFEPFADSHGHEHSKTVINEAPLGMLIPFLFVAASLILLGVFSGDIVGHIIHLAIPSVI